MCIFRVTHGMIMTMRYPTADSGADVSIRCCESMMFCVRVQVRRGGTA